MRSSKFSQSTNAIRNTWSSCHRPPRHGLARGVTTAKPPPPRVHVLGLGSIGAFAAHTLAQIPNKPVVSLLLHRPSLLQDYEQNQKKIILRRRDGEVDARGGFDLETTDGHCVEKHDSRPNLGIRHDATDNLIQNLIVSVKSTRTVAALRPLLPRLSQESTIMFLQNGAGMIEDANQHLWQDPTTRPNYITGVISHGVGLNRPFDITHTGPAATSIGLVPREDNTTFLPTSSSYLLNSLPLVPHFNCRSYGWPDILQLQLEKLAVNALSNPLCGLADTTTAYLFSIPETCHALMREISSIALALPELQEVSGLAERFSPTALEKTVMKVIEQNRETTTSMVWDLRAGRETEIDYINGYWARRGRELGLPTPINDGLVEKIKAKSAQRRNSAESNSQP